MSRADGAGRSDHRVRARRALPGSYCGSPGNGGQAPSRWEASPRSSTRRSQSWTATPAGSGDAAGQTDGMRALLEWSLCTEISTKASPAVKPTLSKREVLLGGSSPKWWQNAVGLLRLTRFGFVLCQSHVTALRP